MTRPMNPSDRCYAITLWCLCDEVKTAALCCSMLHHVAPLFCSWGSNTESTLSFVDSRAAPWAEFGLGAKSAIIWWCLLTFVWLLSFDVFWQRLATFGDVWQVCVHFVHGLLDLLTVCSLNIMACERDRARTVLKVLASCELLLLQLIAV